MAHIREFHRRDIQAVKKLVDSTIEASYAGVYCPAAITYFKEHCPVEKILTDAVEGCVFVAEQSGCILGTATHTGMN